jgi:hypothetical protein
MPSKWLFAVLAAALPLVPAARAQQHTVTATLDYDFKKLHSCSEKETSGCIKQFNIYELTGGPTAMRKLFSFPAPTGEKKMKKKITGTSGPLDLLPGVHMFGATAETAEGTESDAKSCTALGKVGAAAVVSLAIGTPQ